jgi:predicted nucleic acid-binding protein
VSAERYDIASYKFDLGTNYFVDTNVWFLVFGPASPRDPRVPVYSEAMKRLRASTATTLVDALVLSEFANSWARFEFNRSGGNNFKAFRDSASFTPVAQDIAISLRSILSFAKPASTAFANINLSAVIATFEGGSEDFNDLLIVETCRSKACILVTDDGDMKKSDIPLVTANRALLIR